MQVILQAYVDGTKMLRDTQKEARIYKRRKPKKVKETGFVSFVVKTVKIV